MEGVAQNIEAKITDNARKKGHGAFKEAYEAPLADALSYYIHEKVTGKSLPPEAKNVLNLYTDEIDTRGQETLEGLDDALTDQVNSLDWFANLSGFWLWRPTWK